MATKESTVKKTYKEVFTFIQAATFWTQKNKGESKFRYALKKVLKSCEKLQATYQEKLEEFDIEFCSVDSAEIIIKDAKGELSFTKDNLRKRNAKRRELFETEVEAPTHVVEKAPDDLEDFMLDAFEWFVLKAQTCVEPVDVPAKEGPVA